MKKFLSIFAVFCLILVFVCACTPKDNQGSSSEVADIESVYSEIQTSSVSVSEVSSKEEPSSSKKEEISSEESSSKKTQRPTRPSDEISSTESSDLIKNVHPSKALSIGMYHFSPYWTYNYSDTKNPRYEASDEDRFEEFNDVVSAGYVNTAIVPKSYIAHEKMWEIAIENDLSIWMSCDKYNSKNGTVSIESFISSIDKKIQIVKSNPEWWEHFCGFHWDEPFLNKQSNADYLTMTEALYKKYGKRIMPAVATGSFTKYEGNENQIDMSATDIKKINPKALAYTTDIGFDSYSVDVREEYGNGTYIDEVNQTYPSIVDGKTYYSEYTKMLLSLFEHDVNVWFYPCAYTTYLWNKGRANEEYCLAHLEFFKQLLEEQRYQGGIFLYTYQQFSNEMELGLQSHLVIKRHNGKIKLRPGDTKWEKYSDRLKAVVKEFKGTYARQAVFDK